MAIFAPIIFFVFSFALGIVLLVFANLIGIAWFEWSPVVTNSAEWLGPKEVGYVMALNWSVSSIVLLPLAGTLILLAMRELTTLPDTLASRHMLVSKDLSPILSRDKRLQKMWRDLRRLAILLLTSFFLLVFAFAIIDFVQVVRPAYQNGDVARDLNDVGATSKIPLDHFALERDWSVAAVLNSNGAGEVDPYWNYIFALAVYILYAGIGIGLMFSFFFVVLVFGVFLMPGVVSQYGLVLIPDLKSNDERRGFEVFGPFFGYAVSVSALCFCMCYLMTLQNIYMRTPDRTLFEFVLTPLMTGLQLPFVKLLEFAVPIGKFFGWDIQPFADESGLPPMTEIVGFTFSKNTPTGAIQAVLAWVVAVFIAVIMIGITYVFLRYSALTGRRFVQGELDANGIRRLRQIVSADENEIHNRMATMKTWPLSWPKLNHAIVWSLLIILSLVFYRLGLLLAGAAVVFIVSRGLKDILVPRKS